MVRATGIEHQDGARLLRLVSVPNRTNGLAAAMFQKGQPSAGLRAGGFGGLGFSHALSNPQLSPDGLADPGRNNH